MTRTAKLTDYAISAPTDYEDFATIGQWTAGGSSGSTATADTTNIETGAASLKLDVAVTVSGNAFATKTISTSFASIYRFTLRVWCDDETTVKNVDIFLTSVSNFASFFKATATSGFTKGWNTIVYHRNDFSNTGSESWDNTMIRLRVRVDANTSTLTAVSVDSLKTGGKYNANLIITFDDGWASQYTEAYAYMQPRALKGTIYINGSSIDTANYCTLSQLTTMRSGGFLIANHTYTHTNLTTVSAADQQTQIQDNIDYMDDNGFGDGAYDLAYPNGGYNDAILALIESMGFKTARSIVEWGKRIQNFPLDNVYTLKIGNCLDSTTAATIKGWMDDLARKGGALILLYHKIVETPTVSTEHSITNFQAEMDYAALLQSQGLITTKTIREFDSGRRNSR